MGMGKGYGSKGAAGAKKGMGYDKPAKGGTKKPKGK